MPLLLRDGGAVGWSFSGAARGKRELPPPPLPSLPPFSVTRRFGKELEDFDEVEEEEAEEAPEEEDAQEFSSPLEPCRRWRLRSLPPPPPTLSPVLRFRYPLPVRGESSTLALPLTCGRPDFDFGGGDAIKSLKYHNMTVRFTRQVKK